MRRGLRPALPHWQKRSRDRTELGCRGRDDGQRGSGRPLRVWNWTQTLRGGWGFGEIEVCARAGNFDQIEGTDVVRSKAEASYEAEDEVCGAYSPGLCSCGAASSHRAAGWHCLHTLRDQIARTARQEARHVPDRNVPKKRGSAGRSRHLQTGRRRGNTTRRRHDGGLVHPKRDARLSEGLRIMDMETRNFIAGEWCKGEDSIENRNPSDLTDVIGHFAQGSAADLDRAIAAARDAQPKWWAAGIQRRHDALMQIGTELMARSAEIGALLSREEGKPLAEGKGEVYRAGQFFTWFAGEALRCQGDQAERSGRKRPPGCRNRSPARTCWGRRHCDAMEFSGGDAGLEDRACAGLWQCGGVEAREPDSRLGRGLGAGDRGGGAACGRFQHGDGRWAVGGRQACRSF